MDQPVQTPPVDRQYMRPIVGRRARPAERSPPPRKGRRGPKSENYLIELTTFHIRRDRRRG
jgi:hypothetical protein